VRLEGKVALITAAGGRLGIATALRFAREGATVVLSDLVGTHLDRVVTEIAEEEGGKALIALGDITRPAHVERIVREAVDAFGRIDVLVNYPIPTPDLDSVLEGAALCASAVVPAMRARRWGRVILTGPADTLGSAMGVPAGLVALTTKLATESARDGVTVNCVMPGVTAEAQLAFDAAAKTLAPMIPMGRIGEPREVAAAQVFFASDESSYVTGQVLYVDGGLSVSA
jgi:3-oxoacyl-[acyl-carrier protein] reductase